MLSKLKATPETIIGRLGYVLLVVVSIVSWSLSAKHLHSWGMLGMKESNNSAWLVPATYDLAPLGLSLVVFQARRKGRSAFVWRLFIVSFMSVSSWINWTSAAGQSTGSHLIAASLPIAAVVLFEALMWQVHRDAMDKVYEGQPIPRVPLLAWFVDTKRAFAVTKSNALRPLDAAEETLRQIQEAHVVTRRPIRRSQATAAVSAASDTLAIEGPKEQAKKAPKGSTKERVLDFKIANPDAPNVDIAAALGVSQATVSRALNSVRPAAGLA